jgi:hypothetical protein
MCFSENNDFRSHAPVSCIRISFFNKAGHYFVACVVHILFTVGWMDAWVVSTFGGCFEYCSYEHEYMNIFKSLILILWGMCLEVGLLGHFLCLILGDLSSTVCIKWLF